MIRWDSFFFFFYLYILIFWQDLKSQDVTQGQG
jgi:hypothetical protein